MKNLRILIVLMVLVLSSGINSCTQNSKEKTWNIEQKNKWRSDCQKLLINRGVPTKDAIDFCDCMLTKTSEKFTPSEVKKITPEEERKLWQECDYQW